MWFIQLMLGVVILGLIIVIFTAIFVEDLNAREIQRNIRKAQENGVLTDFFFERFGFWDSYSLYVYITDSQGKDINILKGSEILKPGPWIDDLKKANKKLIKLTKEKIKQNKIEKANKEKEAKEDLIRHWEGRRKPKLDKDLQESIDLAEKLDYHTNKVKEYLSKSKKFKLYNKHK